MLHEEELHSNNSIDDDEVLFDNNNNGIPIVDATPSFLNATTLSFPPASSTYGDRAKIIDSAYVQMEDDDCVCGRANTATCQDHHCFDTASDALSITSTIMTAEGLADPAGFSIICCVILIGDMTRGVTFPIMWPLVQDLGGNSVWLGYAVGAFSFGRVIASPCFGKWSIEKGYSKTLVASTTIMLVGCVFFAHVISVGSLPFLVFSKIIMGIGSATLGVTRAYVAEITATRQRTMYMALLSAVQYGAYTGMSNLPFSLMHDFIMFQYWSNAFWPSLVPSDADIWGTLLLHTE